MDLKILGFWYLLGYWNTMLQTFYYTHGLDSHIDCSSDSPASGIIAGLKGMELEIGSLTIEHMSLLIQEKST